MMVLQRIVSKSPIGRTGRLPLRQRGARVLLLSTAILCATVSGVWAFTEAQARSGESLYKHQCARCHGDHGEGKDDSFRGLRAPELIGPSAIPCKPRPFEKIRQHDFRTAKDVYDFVSATMPADQPASLESEQYWNILAYTLQANGKAPDGGRLDASSSVQMVLHPDCPPVAAQRAHP
jgi:cytochrome c